MSRSLIALLMMSAAIYVSPVFAADELPAQGVVVEPPPALIDDVTGRAKAAELNASRILTPAADMPDITVEIPQVKAEDLKVKAEPKKKRKIVKTVVEKTQQERTESVINTLVKSDNSNAPMLSIGDALREAYVGNPTLRAARAAVKAEYEKKPQAASYWQPNVDASADVTYSATERDPGGTDTGTEKSAGVSLVQPLYRGGRTIAGQHLADAEVDAQMAMLATTERTVLFQTAQAYMDVLRAQATVTVNEKNRDAIARQLRATNDRFRVGDLTRTDVSQSEFRLAQAEAELTTSIGSLRSARAVFEQLVGLLPERLALPSPMFNFPNKLDDAITMAETYNSDVIMAEALHRAAQQNIDVQFGELLPEIALSAGASMTRDPAGGVYDEANAGSVGVSFSMPLYEGGATRSRVRQAKYTANEKFMTVLEARRMAREQAVRSWEDLNAARAEMKSREAQVKAAEVARSGVYQEADVGQRTILDSLDADLEVRDAQIALIAAKRNEVVAEYALASALGLLLPGNVGIQETVFNPIEYGQRVGGTAFGTGVEVEPETGR